MHAHLLHFALCAFVSDNRIVLLHIQNSEDEMLSVCAFCTHSLCVFFFLFLDLRSSLLSKNEEKKNNNEPLLFRFSQFALLGHLCVLTFTLFMFAFIQFNGTNDGKLKVVFLPFFIVHFSTRQFFAK